MTDIEGVGTVEVCRKGKKFYGKKEKVEVLEEKEFEDGGGACSGTEEGGNDNSMKGKVKFEVSNEKIEHSHQTPRKRSKKLFFGGASSVSFMNVTCYYWLPFSVSILLYLHKDS